LKMEIHFWHMQKGSDQDTKQEEHNNLMFFFLYCLDSLNK
jgi:hypothetical protein